MDHRDSKVNYTAGSLFSFFLFIITRSVLLVGIRWPFCIAGFQRILYLIFQYGFWFVRIPFGSMVKFQFLAQFHVDHLSNPVVPSLIGLLLNADVLWQIKDVTLLLDMAPVHIFLCSYLTSLLRSCLSLSGFIYRQDVFPFWFFQYRKSRRYPSPWHSTLSNTQWGESIYNDWRYHFFLSNSFQCLPSRSFGDRRKVCDNLARIASNRFFEVVYNDVIQWLWSKWKWVRVR